MEGKNKTQKQLIRELTKLRQRIAELKATGRKHNQFEETLRTERDKAQQYLDIAEVILVALDKKGIITFLNRKGSQLLGYKEGELIGKNWFTTCLPSYLHKDVKGVFKKIITGEKKQLEVYENPVLTKSGTERLVAWHTTVLKDARGNIIGTLNSGEDITERRRVEDTSRETSLFLKSILDSSSSISIVFTDLEQNILFWNKGAENIFGYKAEEVVDRHTVDILYPDEGDTKQTVEKIRSYILNKKRGVHREIKEITKDGRILWISLTSTPRFDENRNVIGILGIGEDITERKQIEEALRASEEQFRQFFENEPEYCYMISPEGLIFNVNNAALSALGYTKEELIGKPLQTIYAPESLSKMEQIYSKWKKTGQLKDEELVVITKKGEQRTVLLSAGSVKDSDGKILHSISVQKDITERKNIEDALKESEERFRRVVETMEVGLGTIDENAVLTYVNEYFANMLGYSIDEMIGRSTLDFFEEKSREVQKDIFKKRRAGMRDSTPYEVTWRKKDGQKVYSILSPTPLFDANGHYTGSFAIHTDITKRKQAEEALRESEEKFRNLAEQSPNMIFINAKKRIVYANEECTEITGYTREELYAPDFEFMTLIAPESMSLVKVLYSKHMQGEEFPPYEYTLITKEGRRIEAINATKLIQYAGESALLGIVTDISERKKAEQELRHSYQQMQEMMVTTVNALASTVEMKDQYTAGHQPRVAQLACVIALEMGLSEEQIEGIRIAGLIHDIGKIMVPAEILNKPGPLTEIQYEMVKMHPQAGYDILKDIKFPWAVAQMVLQHHELMDGSGYPQGLSGEKIMVEAKILAVANVVEAMVSHRPYRAAFNIKEALGEISKTKGTLYDPAVVDACQKVFAQKLFSFEETQ